MPKIKMIEMLLKNDDDPKIKDDLETKIKCHSYQKNEFQTADPFITSTKNNNINNGIIVRLKKVTNQKQVAKLKK